MKEKGFTLAEVVIVIAILSFGVVLVYGAFSMMRALTFNISARTSAAYLAVEGLEIVKNIRDNNLLALARDTSPPNFSWSSGLLGDPCQKGCQADYKTKNGGQFAPYANSFLGLNNDGFYSYDKGGMPTAFKRKITTSPVLGTSDQIKVSVSVTWSYKGQMSEFNVSEFLYNWK